MQDINLRPLALQILCTKQANVGSTLGTLAGIGAGSVLGHYVVPGMHWAISPGENASLLNAAQLASADPLTAPSVADRASPLYHEGLQAGVHGAHDEAWTSMANLGTVTGAGFGALAGNNVGRSIDQTLGLSRPERSLVVAPRSEPNFKYASMAQVRGESRLVDPLDNPEIGPFRSGEIPRVGSNFGRTVGTLAGLGLGSLAGHELGGGLLSGASELGSSIGRLGPSYDEDVAKSLHDGFTTFGKIDGTTAGGLVGAGVGRFAGGGIGSVAGRMGAGFAPAEAHAAQQIKRMSPADGMAHILMLERSGHARPSVIQAMKETYEARRTGLEDQARAGVSGASALRIAPLMPQAPMSR